MPEPRVAIVDYGLGNLFSVQRACESVGLHSAITPDKYDTLTADAVILPGVGAFGDAMQSLRELDLVSALRQVAVSGKPLVGICLGMQLLMSESFEFGRHEGLGLIPGSVVPLGEPRENGRRLKVPQVGWNRVRPAAGWEKTLLEGVAADEFMYFVHSFIVRPADASVAVATTRYGDVEFCAALRARNIFGCQFHPERSGAQGLRMYRNLAAMLHPQTINRERSYV